MHREPNPDAARRSEDGQTMAEYAVVLSVITLAIMLAFQLIGDTSGGLIDRVMDVVGGG